MKVCEIYNEAKKQKRSDKDSMSLALELGVTLKYNPVDDQQAKIVQKFRDCI